MLKLVGKVQTGEGVAETELIALQPLLHLFHLLALDVEHPLERG